MQQLAIARCSSEWEFHVTLLQLSAPSFRPVLVNYKQHRLDSLGRRGRQCCISMSRSIGPVQRPWPLPTGLFPRPCPNAARRSATHTHTLTHSPNTIVETRARSLPQGADHSRAISLHPRGFRLVRPCTGRRRTSFCPYVCLPTYRARKSPLQNTGSRTVKAFRHAYQFYFLPCVPIGQSLCIFWVVQDTHAHAGTHTHTSLTV